MKYLAEFRGRLRGAIGILGIHQAVVIGEDESEARLKLYDSHEHISLVVFWPLSDAGEVEYANRDLR